MCAAHAESKDMPPLEEDRGSRSERAIDPAVQSAFDAFRSAGDFDRQVLLASGIDESKTPSLLLDDLIIESPGEEDDVVEARASSNDSDGGSGGKEVAAAADLGSSSSSSISSAGGGSSSSSSSVSSHLQHVVSSTGATAQEAGKILRLKDEIGRLRATGHSTASIIEQLSKRLRDAGEQREEHLWGEDEEDEEDEGEPADEMVMGLHHEGKASSMGGRRALLEDKGANGQHDDHYALKKRRVGDGGSAISPFSAGRLKPDNAVLEYLPVSGGLALSDAFDSAGGAGGGVPLAFRAPEGKRSREEIELGHFKKLKLRSNPQQENPEG